MKFKDRLEYHPPTQLADEEATMTFWRAVAVVGFLVGCAAGSLNAQSHLGQSPSNHVTLESIGVDSKGCHAGGTEFFEFFRILPNGTQETNPFRVPTGHVFVVTDVDWQFATLDGSAASGNHQVLRLFIENLADATVRRRAFESTIVLSSTGEGGTSESMTSGFTVSPEARLCFDNAPRSSFQALQHVIVRGYLTRQR